ncbi:MAG: DUF4136 domain-containing protein [Pseudomonadales bacterium]|nr:DUF4136 domain-containing protein [Pseudomonadales bacterium]
MKKILLRLSPLMLILLLSACTSYIGMNSTYFYQEDFPKQGRILIVAAAPEQNDSLEFLHYKELFKRKLSELGYGLTDEKDQAELVALITYGIDSGNTQIKSQPIYGYTGFYGYRGRYSMPHYTVVGVQNIETTEYTRAIAMDLLDAQSIRDGEPKKLYEVRVKSRGKCANLNQVFPAMINGMFAHFPGESGKTEFIEVEGEDC